MVRIALTSFRKDPKLSRCEPKSVFASVIIASQLGLEPGIGGQGYLIPYLNRKMDRYECQFIPGWQGLVDLVARAGRASVWTGAVYDGDVFDYALGDAPFVHHKPCGEEKKLIAVYAVGRVNGATYPVVEVWPFNKIESHRDRYNQVGKSHYSYENIEMYGRKVALLQVLKYMPKSVELQTAIDLDHSAPTGQGLTIDDAVTGNWVGEPDEPPEPEGTKLGVEAVKEQLGKKRPGDAA